MKTTLLVSCFVLGLCSLSFSQPQADTNKDQDAQYQRYLKSLGLATPVLEEDSAKISTYTKKTQFMAGEDIVLGITLANMGTKTFGATRGNDDVDFFFDIEVTGPGRRKVAFLPSHDRRRERSGSPDWSVAPNKSRDASVWLNNLFDLDSIGQYTVVVSKKFKRNNALVTVSSAPLTFEITSTKPIAQWK